ncbi:1,6-anhydro-N-acetylmuramyl-L-alanine amidase AmpD [Gammaproteobacteria bacterium]|nr:1,6-anhydro-N-acetylmuramyl-L-alanine amidase AmpD [Gammaproteobacteria bacterium]MDA8696412.1 1,6-anhydro-N-acetylmuramyl-L-alanine amidase AmpD [Gammaproteobacteria bacterium]MDA9024678.1 1,6-anhydro-N-acetylmuramyl-L-alanine amidase AmpD [Gammaproteobacteria bacterium]MDA9195764.1 1,6-anhydro-N-acetylmuramyl-L-alanine amidase AmpD [Gammaproteobacteria bacterium]MDB4829485.1 1,6-anhydro-N-acetylmuramyl-L-alanine amidase AmpD [Gammaproteobacteria bacterium]|tara:strand:- start:1662 stop:2201 length:540 start_codon:yes stop_codon:yes gene_type:complete
MEIKNHRLTNINFLRSPNFNERPEGALINMIIIHSISLPLGEYENDNVERFFLNKLDKSLHTSFKELNNLKVSSHLYIKRNGEIIQFVPFDRRAWHAGESSFRGQDNCNDNSIGIELEGTDNSEFNHHQYDSLKKAIKLLTSTYSEISIDRIVGHSDVAPNRKTDPGQLFDWGILKGIA